MEESRHDREIRRGRKGNEEGRSSERNVPKSQKRASELIDYGAIYTDCARYLGVYDIELILSWTPNEYRAFIKGAQHREIDEYERMAKAAMFNRYATNAKKANEKKMFDAKQARKRLEENDSRWKESREPSLNQKRYKRMKQALEGFVPVFSEGRDF
ncbi:hypothetical protein [Priestia flexa]|uniref:hypothetical protein n=1 Tax=Priestia flexa TaxID=86664 RepID=UPI001CFE8E8A|nr:hypothetical protein [Priestia flexa]